MLVQLLRPNSRAKILLISISLVLLLCSLYLIFILPFTISSLASSLPQFLSPTSKTIATNDLLIIYVYHETDNARDNARFFIKHGLHSKADFIFVINGENDFESEIPIHYPNVELRSRDNSCFDLGTYGEILNEDNRKKVQKYKKFILMNASTRGPFVPIWTKACWSTVYTNMVTDQIKMAGMTYNCQTGYPPHVQSMILATDQIGIDIMSDTCLSVCHNGHEEGVDCEIGLTRGILDAGYGVNALMAAYQAARNGSYLDICPPTDPTFNNGYHGFNLHPYETLFFKANRDVDPVMIESYTKWHGQMEYSSWDACANS